MSRGTRSFCTLAVILATQIAAASAAPPRYVASRDILIEFQSANATAVTGADVWVSTDAGRTWQPAEVARDGDRTLRYTAPADGKYDFYVVLRNESGTSGPAPEPGTSPAISVIVDTVPPLFQAHAATIEPGDDGRPMIALKTTLVEENLAESAVRVFYRTPPGDWLDGGPAHFATDRILWSPPQPAGPVLDLRIVATDRAGNRTSSDVRDVTIRSTTTQPATSRPASAAAGKGVKPVEPPKVAPVAPPVAATTQPTSAPAPLSPTDAASVQNLRTLAARFISEGRYSLAAARLEDALAISPQDPDLMAAAGNALYRAGRYDDADARFKSALTAMPDHVPALEGLALVAATQKRYSQAREQLLHLQRLRPDSGSVWLRSGDIEHQLGNTTQAIAAWQRVLTAADADADLRAKAQRRLEYFAPGRTTHDQPSILGSQWESQSNPRRSSSSTETTNTRNRPR